MTIAFIVAASLNNVIGKDNHLPWHLPNDMKYFKQMTTGHPIVMGRKTFDELGKALPNRENIVISRNKDFKAPGIQVVPSLDAALELASHYSNGEIFITGGGQIFHQALPHCHRQYITRIMGNYEGDAFYPPIDASQFRLVKQDYHEPDEKHAVAYDFQVWDRIEK
ncbi:dihydrofolate reductase [Chitinophaga costaii]|uniref:Dihydrofolate reductase n=1 Tax=Chitinophaga costaii TaxID=1335309 RepID=A0A1C4FWL3_9BACT|nr:dihydrofolate reductase [Chitinophaga costaii]PUZ27278.1 dihydrofolate reductase [Chitinophaga costaii]SCC60246.1 dihydrofolate reductase [Chitinophaga costaii]